MDLFTKIKSITSFTTASKNKLCFYFNDLPRHGKTRY